MALAIMCLSGWGNKNDDSHGLCVQALAPPPMWIFNRKAVPQKWLDEFVKIHRDRRDDDLDPYIDQLELLRHDNQRLYEENERLQQDNIVLKQENRRIMREKEFEMRMMSERSEAYACLIEAEASQVKAKYEAENDIRPIVEYHVREWCKYEGSEEPFDAYGSFAKLANKEIDTLYSLYEKAYAAFRRQIWMGNKRLSKDTLAIQVSNLFFDMERAPRSGRAPPGHRGFVIGMDQDSSLATSAVMMYFGESHSVYTPGFSKRMFAWPFDGSVSSTDIRTSSSYSVESGDFNQGAGYGPEWEYGRQPGQGSQSYYASSSTSNNVPQGYYVSENTFKQQGSFPPDSYSARYDSGNSYGYSNGSSNGSSNGYSNGYSNESSSNYIDNYRAGPALVTSYDQYGNEKDPSASSGGGSGYVPYGSTDYSSGSSGSSSYGLDSTERSRLYSDTNGSSTIGGFSAESSSSSSSSSGKYNFDYGSSGARNGNSRYSGVSVLSNDSQSALSGGWSSDAGEPELPLFADAYSNGPFPNSDSFGFVHPYRMPPKTPTTKYVTNEEETTQTTSDTPLLEYADENNERESDRLEDLFDDEGKNRRQRIKEKKERKEKKKTDDFDLVDEAASVGLLPPLEASLVPRSPSESD